MEVHMVPSPGRQYGRGRSEFGALFADASLYGAKVSTLDVDHRDVEAVCGSRGRVNPRVECQFSFIVK
jgi:hypothetical protein